MSVVHLSEIEIQEYLDTQINKEKVESHILTCEDCAILLAEYETFYQEISIDIEPDISPNFVTNTMQIVREETMFAEGKGFYLYSILGLIFAFAMLKYYVGYSFTLPQLHTPQLTGVFTNWSIVQTLNTFYHSSPTIANNLLLAGAMLLFVGLIDVIFSRKLSKKVSCFSI